MQLNTANLAGLASKSVHIACNDPVQPTAVLTLQATVWKPVEVTPAQVIFNLNGAKETKQVKLVRITNKLEEPIQISAPEVDHPGFKAELTTVQPGKAFELRIRPAENPGIGTLRFPIRLKTSSTNAPVIKVDVLAVLPTPIEVTPTQVLVPPSCSNSPAQLSLTIQNNRTNSLAISSVEVVPPQAKAELKEIQPGRLFEVALSFPPGFTPSPNARIVAKTSDPQYPELTIPIRAAGRQSLASPGQGPQFAPSYDPRALPGSRPLRGNVRRSLPASALPESGSPDLEPENRLQDAPRLPAGLLGKRMRDGNPSNGGPVNSAESAPGAITMPSLRPSNSSR